MTDIPHSRIAAPPLASQPELPESTSGARPVGPMWSPTAASAGSAGWKLTVLLALAIFINYIDRGNLATAAPLIKSDLGLSALQIGVLTSAFFWIYVPGQLTAGWLVDRVGGHRSLAFGFALWCAATALTGLASGFAMLLGLRVLLGVGETVAFPALSKLLAEALPPAELGLANSIATAGVSLGPAVGVLVGGLVMATIGWRAMFVLFGAVALLWLLPWTLHGRAARRESRSNASPAPTYREITGQRAFWGSTLGHFCNIYGVYFVLSWMPLWLVQQHGYTVLGMARILAAVYAFTGTTAIISGWLCDRLIRGGRSITAVRKTISVLGHLGSAGGLVGCAIGPPRILLPSLALGAASLTLVAIWPITQTLAGPRAAGRWVGTQNCIANFAGIIGPAVTGWIVDRTGAFDLAFLITAGVVLIGALGWGLVVVRVEQVNWSDAAIKTDS